MFRAPSTKLGFYDLVVIFAGWVLTPGDHAVTQALVATCVAERVQSWHSAKRKGRARSCLRLTITALWILTAEDVMGGLWDDDDTKDDPLPETDYFLFTSALTRESARISLATKLPPRYSNWMTGTRLEFEVPRPLMYEVAPDDEGLLRPFFEEPGAPVMSDELVTALRRAGVDNVDTYNAIICEVRTGAEHRNYKAVNILGLVNGADMEKSRYNSSALGGKPHLDVWFDKLVLDEKKIRGNLFFRLAENVGWVLAHRRVVESINASQIPLSQFLAFVHPGERSG